MLFLDMSSQIFTWGTFDITNKWKEKKSDSNGVLSTKITLKNQTLKIPRIKSQEPNPKKNAHPATRL